MVINDTPSVKFWWFCLFANTQHSVVDTTQSWMWIWFQFKLLVTTTLEEAMQQTYRYIQGEVSRIKLMLKLYFVVSAILGTLSVPMARFWGKKEVCDNTMFWESLTSYALLLWYIGCARIQVECHGKFMIQSALASNCLLLTLPGIHWVWKTRKIWLCGFLLKAQRNIGPERL